MRAYIILATIVLYNLNVSAQILRRVPLTASDSMTNVQYRYEGKGDFYEITLSLIADGTYQYSESGSLQSLYSCGVWKLSTDTLVLNSEIQKDNVPVSISYTKETSDVVNNFRFGVVRNLKGDYLTDAFININADTVKCLPMMGACLGTYKVIDSARLLFENGFTSKWVRVNDDGNSRILFKVNTNLEIASFIPFQNFKYKFTRKSLQVIADKN